MQLLLFLCIMFFSTGVGAMMDGVLERLERVVIRLEQSEYHNVLKDRFLPTAFDFYKAWEVDFDNDGGQHHTFYSERPLPTSNDKPTMSKRRRELERMACLLRCANRDKKFAQQHMDARRFVDHGKTNKNSCIKNKAHHLSRPKPRV